MTEFDSADDSVGYKKPPRHTRFRPGQSGNPRGRQKGLRNFGTDVKATLEAKVAVNENGGRKRVSTQEAMLLRLREKALKGDTRALDLLIRLAQLFNHDGPGEAGGEQEMAAEDREILDAYVEARMTRAATDACTGGGAKTPEGDIDE
jgi:hypothetical protein